MRNVVSSSSRVVHGSQELEAFDLAEITSIVLRKEIESLCLDQLAGDFKSDLVAPSVHEGHGHVIKEHSHLFATRRSESSDLLLLDLRFDGLLEVEGGRSRREVDSLEHHDFVVKLAGVHHDN